MLWTCSNCNTVAHVSKLPVYCHCGYVTYEYVNNGLVKERLAVCNTCKHYRKSKCIKIDLGCKNTFANYIHHPTKQCPLGMWKNSA